MRTYILGFALLALAASSCECGGTVADAGDGDGDGGAAEPDGGSASGDAGVTVDAGTGAGIDAGTDAGTDAGMDAGIDAGTDAGAAEPTDGGSATPADAGADAGTDAGPQACSVDNATAGDSFEGGGIDGHWAPDAVGMLLSYMVSGGDLIVDDAAFVGDALSWITDIETDRGNQMQWDQPVGTGDFTLAFNLAMESDEAQATYIAIALISGGDQIEVIAGGEDSTDSGLGTWSGIVRQEFTDAADFRFVSSPIESSSWTVERTLGVVTISLNGEPLISGDNTSDITSLAIVTVRRRDGLGEYEYGTGIVHDVALCY